MKHLASKTFFIAFLGIAITGCKNENNKAKTEEAREAREANVGSENFRVNSDESVIHWKGRKPTATHTGTIKIAEGNFTANDSTIESGNFVIDMKSIEVTDLEGKDRSDLEAHLKGTVEGKEGDFFNTEEFPEATFEITDLTEENGQAMLSGNLTIKEDTKNISFPVRINHSEDQVEITSDEFSIDRTQWKVNFGSKSVFDGLGDNFVYDDINLRIKVIADKS
ncbi:MAG TPA: YceI family protein [Salegentibacter sp.]|nr:YceI family protein [Salegentibacter sp.]